MTNASHVIWRLELLTAWQACTNQLALPLLGVTCFAKVTATVAHGGWASCMSGGVGLSLEGSDGSAHLPWDATEAQAESAVASLVPDGAGVMVHRSGDGHAAAVFTVTFLGGGDWPALVLDHSTLHRTQPLLDGATWLNASSTANATAEEVVPGGIDLTPLPGRYLSAPSNTSVASVRLAGTTTALCAAPDWDQLHQGCYAAALFGAPRTTAATLFSTPTYGGHTPAGQTMSLESCAQACGDVEAIALSPGSYDTAECYCLSRLPSAPAAAAAACSSACPGDAAQLCGGGSTAEEAAAAQGGGGSIAVVLGAYGSLAEYEDAATHKLLRSKLGAAAGVGVEQVSLHVSPSTTVGAVLLSATVRLPMASMLHTVLSALQAKLADGPLASTALGVEVEGGGNSPSVSQSLFASVCRTP